MVVSWFIALALSPRGLVLPPPAPVPSAPVQPAVTPEPTADAGDDASDDDDDAADAEDGDEAEAEATATDPEAELPSSAPTDDRLRYSTDIAEGELEERFCKDPASLGSISVGFADAGRVINAVQMPTDEAWELVVPEYAWGTAETVEYLSAAGRAVKMLYPDAPALRINHIGRKEGGYLRPHRSHQSGRDVDLGFYYKNGRMPGRVRHRAHLIDLAHNWALVRSLVTMSDVQVILVDRKIQAVLYQHALASGEDKEWLDSLFHSGPKSVLQHAKRHRDHFHVRFFSPRSQELGRRVHPILAKRPDDNRMMHRVRNGDTLGGIARKYGSSISMILKANGMRNSFLRLGRVLSVPLRGPCTQCPIPPPFVVPPRRLPPQTAQLNN